MWWPIVLILWIACSVLCYAIMKSKGYPNEKCLAHGVGGFFLGFIWIIVVLCKKPFHDFSYHNSNNLSSNSESYLTQIQKLAELKEQGIITEEEFEEKKHALLNKI